MRTKGNESFKEIYEVFPFESVQNFFFGLEVMLCQILPKNPVKFSSEELNILLDFKFCLAAIILNPSEKKPDYPSGIILSNKEGNTGDFDSETSLVLLSILESLYGHIFKDIEKFGISEDSLKALITFKLLLSDCIIQAVICKTEIPSMVINSNTISI